MKAMMRYEQVLRTVLCIFMAVFPFVMGFHVEELSGAAETYFAKKSGYMTDIFQHHKEIVLIFFAVFLLVLLILGAVLSAIMVEKLPDKYRVDKASLFLMGGFLLLHIISCIFSAYPEYAFLGLCLDYEGMAAIAGYAVLFIGGYILLGNENGMRSVLISIRILSVLLAAGAFLECAAGPLFNMTPVARALTPDGYEHLLENIYLDYHGSVSLTFANPGYFGGFCTLLFPILYGMAANGGSRRARVCDGVLAGCVFFCIIMSGSSGALYAALIAAAAETVFAVWKGKGKKCLSAIPVTVVSAAAVFALMSGTQIMDGPGMAERLGGSVVNSQYTGNESGFHVDQIQLQDGELTIQSGENILHVQAVGDGEEMSVSDIRFTDGNGAEIGQELTVDGTRLSGEYSGVTAAVLGRTLSLDLGYQDPVEFYCYDGRLRYIDFNGSLLESIPQPQVKGLEFLYPLFTGRGYIWVSSLPLLKDCIFLGKGVGTFPFYYPQSEVAGMLNVHGSADYCIEIAHSWYLQTAVNGGVIALLCMAALFIVHLARGGRMYWRRVGQEGETPEISAGQAVFFGLLAYQIVGIVNNSSIPTAPVFWILFGCSMGFLKMCRQKSSKNMHQSDAAANR